jgi:hypothetical protein
MDVSFFAEVGQSWGDLWSYEALELINDFKRFQIDYHQANLNRFHLIGGDYELSC